MPARGSAIGASMGGLGSGLIGGSATSLRTANIGQVYGPPAAAGNNVHTFLWVMVALEVVALIALRHAFRHYHGG